MNKHIRLKAHFLKHEEIYIKVINKTENKIRDKIKSCVYLPVGICSWSRVGLEVYKQLNKTITK